MLDNIYVANETFNEYREAEDDRALKELKDSLHPKYEMGRSDLVFRERQIWKKLNGISNHLNHST